MATIGHETKREFVGEKGEILYNDQKVGGFFNIHVAELTEYEDTLEDNDKGRVLDRIEVRLLCPHIGTRYLDLFGWGKNAKGTIVLGGTDSEFTITVSGKLYDGFSETRCRATLTGVLFDFSEHKNQLDKWCEDLDQKCRYFIHLSGKCQSFDCINT